jgi:hypothetical protein
LASEVIFSRLIKRLPNTGMAITGEAFTDIIKSHHHEIFVSYFIAAHRRFYCGIKTILLPFSQ